MHTQSLNFDKIIKLLPHIRPCVQDVGVEFYGNAVVSGESFPALEKLKFQNMSAWKVWSSDNGSSDECAQSFPKLLELVISDCPDLKRELPSYLPALRKLTINGCPQLIASMESLPSLEELDINGCRAVVSKNMVNMTSLTKLRMVNVAEQVRDSAEAFTQAAEALREVDVDINYLNLLIDGNGKIKEMIHLQVLNISNFDRLQCFPDEFLTRSLKMLTIKGCERLESFSLGNLPPTLESITIKHFSNLRFLTGEIMGDDRDKAKLLVMQMLADQYHDVLYLGKEGGLHTQTMIWPLSAPLTSSIKRLWHGRQEALGWKGRSLPRGSSQKAILLGSADPSITSCIFPLSD